MDRKAGLIIESLVIDRIVIMSEKDHYQTDFHCWIFTVWCTSCVESLTEYSRQAYPVRIALNLGFCCAVECSVHPDAKNAKVLLLV